MTKRKRILRKLLKQRWVASFGAFKATRRFAWTAQNGQLCRRSVTVLHLLLLPRQVRPHA